MLVWRTDTRAGDLVSNTVPIVSRSTHFFNQFLRLFHFLPAYCPELHFLIPRSLTPCSLIPRSPDSLIPDSLIP
jgi:hypothetical protein